MSLARYLGRRVITAFIVVLIVMAFLASLDRLIPGNPVTYVFGPHANPALIRQVRHQMGLDVSVPQQIYQYIVNAFQGNLGINFVTNQSVASLVMQNLPYTLVLAVLGLGPRRPRWRSAGRPGRRRSRAGWSTGRSASSRSRSSRCPPSSSASS